MEAGSDLLPGSTQHGPVPLMMQIGANPNNSVTPSRTTRAPSLTSRAGTLAGFTCSTAISLPAGRCEEEEPMPPMNIFHVWITERERGGAFKQPPCWIRPGESERKKKIFTAAPQERPLLHWYRRHNLLTQTKMAAVPSLPPTVQMEAKYPDDTADVSRGRGF